MFEASVSIDMWPKPVLIGTLTRANAEIAGLRIEGPHRLGANLPRASRRLGKGLHLCPRHRHDGIDPGIVEGQIAGLPLGRIVGDRIAVDDID